MKELVTVFAVCAIVGAAMAVDSNVVGYNTVDVLADDMTMMGVNFDAVGGGGTSIQIALAGSFNGGEDMSSSDNLIVWKADGGYKSYYYGVWNDLDNPEWDNLWYDSDSIEATTLLNPGDAIWYTRRGGVTPVTICGEVLATGSIISILANDMTMFANTHPVPVPLNGVGGLDVLNPIGGEDMDSSDNLIVWTLANGYQTYYYGVWNDLDNPEWDNLWYDDNSVEATVSLAVGQAAWYIRKGGATTITFPSVL